MNNDNPFYTMEFGYFNALLASVVGDNEQKVLANEYLKDVDKEWDE